MNETGDKVLLPEGVKDVLPPEAARESAVVSTILTTFSHNGYARVKPPLVEFEETLLTGVGASRAAQTFRVMDPLSHRMMGVRSDVTTQVARIAATRLGRAPRPLRLMYAEPVLRVSGRQIRPERQFTQAGLEMIGSESIEADAEVIVLAVEAVLACGVKNVTLDVNIPNLASQVLDQDIDGTLASALDHRDVAEVQRLGGSNAGVLIALVEASGTLQRARSAVASLDIPDKAKTDIDRLFGVIDLVEAAKVPVEITVDFVESKGFQYHRGIGFSLFAKGTHRDLGRGGRYGVVLENGSVEPAIGATLFIDTVVPLAEIAKARPRVLVPHDTPWPDRKALIASGIDVVAALEGQVANAASASAAGCTHVLVGGKPAPVSEKG